jgi:hypothetical protein
MGCCGNIWNLKKHKEKDLELLKKLGFKPEILIDIN